MFLANRIVEKILPKQQKGLLDFGLLIDPADLTRYDSLRLPDRDRWGVVISLWLVGITKRSS